MSRGSRTALIVGLGASALAVAWLARSIGSPSVPDSDTRAGTQRVHELSPSHNVLTDSAETPNVRDDASAESSRAIVGSRTAITSDDGDRLFLDEDDVWKVPEDQKIWIPGRVIFPAGTPAEEAVSIESDLRSLIKVGGGGAIRSRYDTQAVDGAGSFRVWIPRRARIAALRLKARFLYLPQDYLLEPAAPPAEITLRPKLGGVLRVRAVLSPTETGRARQLDGSVQVTRQTIPAESRDGTDSGQPLTAAYVVENEEPNESRGAHLRTNLSSDLGAEFHALPAPAMYKVRLESRAALRRIEASIVVRPGETAQLDMALSLGVWITGRVVLENGTAVSDARIHAAVTGLEGTDLQPWTKLCDCWTRRFDCFGIPPGNVTLVVTKPGYLPTQWSAGTLAEGDSVEDAVIVLKKGSAIAGRVHWPAGITPTRCEIAAHQHLDGDWVIPATALLSTNVWTREDGTFEIGGLGPSAVDLDTSVRVEIADPKTLRGLGLEGAAAAAPSTDHEREGAVAPKPKRVRFAATAQAITPGSTGVVLELHPVE